MNNGIYESRMEIQRLKEENEQLRKAYELSCKRNNEANVRIGELIKERNLYRRIAESCECND